MGFQDFVSGATELPRELIGGAATALGADPESTREFLNLEKESNTPASLSEQISNNPSKFLGELVPYVFLPTRLFGKAASKALRAKAVKTGKRSDKLKAAANEVGHMGLAFGAFGGAHEAAQASLEDRDSHVVQQAITDGLFTVGFASLAKGAFVGATKFKDKVAQSKYIKDTMMDAGIPPKMSSDISKLSEADRRAALIQLDNSAQNSMQALSGISKEMLPASKFKEIGTPNGWLNKMFKELSPIKGDAAEALNKSVEKTALKHVGDRPAILPKEGKYNIDKEARKPVAEIRMSADDLNSHLNIIGRHSNNLRTQIIQMMPDPNARARITQALDVGGSKAFEALNPDEKIVATKLREVFDQMGHHLENQGIIKGFLPEYVPHLLNKVGSESKSTFQEMLDSVAKRSHISTNSARGKRRLPNAKPLHEREDALTTDIADLIHLYTLEVARATAMKNVFKKIDLKSVQSGENKVMSLSPKENFVEVDVASHPSLITNYLKDTEAAKPFIRGIHEEFVAKHTGIIRDHYKSKASYYRDIDNWKKSNPKEAAFLEKETNKAIDKRLPEHFEELRQGTKLYVHQDYKPSIDLLMKANNTSDLMKGVIWANFASKRALIIGSLFHFNALSESSLFAGAGGMGAAAKGAGAGFLLTGANPLGAAVGAGLGAGAHVLLRTKNIAAQLRGGEYGDIYDFAQRYIDIKPPRDVGTDEFYNGLSSIQGVIDKYVPTNTAKGLLKKGTKAVGGINKTIDVLMWHRLMAGAKITVFQRNLERLTEKNAFLPKIEQRSQHELATVAGQFTNDAFGGQNWRKLAEGVDNKFGRRWAAAASTEAGNKWANLVMFAPDWTISNLRVIGKAFPLINKDKLSRQMYQRYALRAAIYYAIMGSAIQYALTGKTIIENYDPTKLDLGDGRTMTFSKQLMEPFHWMADPVHETTAKQSSILKLGEELATNRQYIGGGNGTPKIWHDDETPLEKVGNTVQVAGKHFAPIFIQDIGRNGPEGVYGFFGHPIYGNIRYGFKNSDGKIDMQEER